MSDASLAVAFCRDELASVPGSPAGEAKGRLVVFFFTLVFLAAGYKLVVSGDSAGCCCLDGFVVEF